MVGVLYDKRRFIIITNTEQFIENKETPMTRQRDTDDYNIPSQKYPKTKNNHARKKQIKLFPRETPGMICIERHIHDEAIVISGSLMVENNDVDLCAWIEEELENAARYIKDCGGILGQIKTALTVASTKIISITDDKATEAKQSQKYARIILAAIIFMLNPREADEIVRKALAGVRARLRQSA